MIAGRESAFASCRSLKPGQGGLGLSSPLDVSIMVFLALPLDLTGVLVVAVLVTLGVLLIAYALAGWYERRARRRRERQSKRAS